jgi:hypothetical protein
VLAGATVSGQMLAKECLHVRSEGSQPVSASPAHAD